MIKRFQSYIDKEFCKYPASKELVDLKEELVGVLMEKYTEATKAGKGELDAYAEAISSMSDLREIYKDQMSALQFTVKEVVDKTKLIIVISMWYYVGLLLIFLGMTFLAKDSAVPIDWRPSDPDSLGYWLVFPFGAFAYVIGLMVYLNFNSKLSKRNFVKRLSMFVIPFMTALIIFFACGMFGGLWNPTWLVFIAATAVAIILDGYIANASKKGNIVRIGLGGLVLIVAVQLLLMKWWPNSWIIYVILAFFGLVGLSVVLTKK